MNHLSLTLRLALSVIIPAVAGLVGTWFAVKVFASYGWALFLALPVMVSFLSSLIFRRTGQATWAGSYGVSMLAILLLGAMIMLLAIDGLICLLMALPLAAALALLGASAGHLLGRRLSAGLASAAPLLLAGAFPFLVAFEGGRPTDPRLHEVTTQVDVSAPASCVWDEVIAFDRIEDPPSGIFRFGIAYPIEATIEGTGVGAIRHCVFSTGPFIEPITRWDAPHALEFDVTSNPPPMEELSPWGWIQTPHLRDTFVSKRGRFRLREENGHTILEGTTWYRQTIAPDLYWHKISDHIIHLIHLRVLEHIKRRAEQKAGAGLP